MKIRSNIILFSIILLFISGCKNLGQIATTVPPVKMLAESIRFAAIGDFGLAGEGEEAVANMIKGWAPDFIITLGDNNYENGNQETLIENIGQYFCDYIYNFDAPEELRCVGTAALEKTNRFFPCPGNHDAYNKKKLKPYLNYFTLPGNEEYYDFIWGPVHFFSLNSLEFVKSKKGDSKQIRWLKNGLLNSTSKFKIVYFHHPPYSVGVHGETKQMQLNFEEWGATSVIAGHDHIYVRINKKDNPVFPYFVSGLGGRSVRECGLQPLDSAKFDVFCYDRDYGAMLITADSEKILFEFYSISQPDEPIDSYIIEIN